MNLPEEQINNIRTAGLLHDIGKIGIPDSILNKQASLTLAEWGPIKTHPEIGVEILRHVIELENCLPLILHHHERFDGKGYPSGLIGDSIPLGARILTIADSYDAMTTPRPYRAVCHAKTLCVNCKDIQVLSSIRSWLKDFAV
jgi:HD-GYP domain-containing protein (c-di-GMP phosphodiesterase class II)